MSSRTATPAKTPVKLAGNASIHALAGDVDDYKLFRSIMDRVNDEFVKPDGLDEVCQSLGLEHQAPRNKISVLIFGNHSAGKSSFINWYVGEKVQTESMAMETSGFTFVTSGKKRATFRGAATIRHFPFIKGIEAFTGVQEYLTTEVVPSTLRNFPFVDLIDSPGLTDGKLQYAFDVNGILCWLAQRVDLIFVFFDPHGQAMVERTMDVVKLLKMVQNQEKVHYFLTKADSIATEAERLKVLSQLSQNLSAASREVSNDRYYGQHALEVKTIYRPHEDLEESKAVPCRLNGKDDDGVGEEEESDGDDGAASPSSKKKKAGKNKKSDFNQINELVALVDRTVKQNVQTHCEVLEKTCTDVSAALDRELELHEQNSLFNQRTALGRWSLLLVAWALPIFLLSYALHFIETIFFAKQAASSWSAPLIAVIRILSTVAELFDSSNYRYHILAGVMTTFIVFLLAARILTRMQVKLRSDDEIKKLLKWRKYVKTLIDPKTGLANQLWDRFIAGSVDPI